MIWGFEKVAHVTKQRINLLTGYEELKVCCTVLLLDIIYQKGSGFFLTAGTFFVSNESLQHWCFDAFCYEEKSFVLEKFYGWNF